MTYDTKCEKLARQWFLDYAMSQQSLDKRVPELAARIQKAIEDYCEEEGLECRT